MIDLRLGDCLEVMATLPDASVDAVVTDPPYLLGASSARVSADKVRPWASDIENAAYWYTQWYREAWRILKSTGCFWTFSNWHTLAVVQCAAAKSAIRVTSVLVWDKQWPGVGSTRGLRQYYELIALMAKPEFTITDRSLGDIWQHKWSGHKPTGHPQEKPVDLALALMVRSELPPNSIVFDPFMGSGTTGVAALQGGFSFIGIEREPDYFKIAQDRIETAAAALHQLELAV